MPQWAWSGDIDPHWKESRFTLRPDPNLHLVSEAFEHLKNLDELVLSYTCNQDYAAKNSLFKFLKSVMDGLKKQSGRKPGFRVSSGRKPTFCDHFFTLFCCAC